MRSRGAVVGLLVLSSCGLELVGIGTSSTPAIDGQDADPPAPIADAQPSDAPLVVEVDADADAALDAAPAEDGAPCNACPATTAQRLCVDGRCVATRRAFVTRAGFAPTFQSPADADGRCEAAARAAGLGGTWMSWLAFDDSIPFDRFTKPNVNYRLLDGTEVATPNGLLPLDGSSQVRLLHAIDRDERNAVVSGQIEVWTGLNVYGFRPSGLSATGGGNCSNWTSTSVLRTARVGHLSAMTGSWTDSYDQDCGRVGQHLYCFEQ